jgi:hypothetical protein
MHAQDVGLGILKRNSDDEDVLQQSEDLADKTAQSYDKPYIGCIERRGNGMSSERGRKLQGKPGTEGPQRVLERRPTDAGTGPDVCNADAGCCSIAGEGLFVSSPSLPAQAGLCTVHPCRRQAKRRRNATSTLG